MKYVGTSTSDDNSDYDYALGAGLVSALKLVGGWSRFISNPFLESLSRKSLTCPSRRNE